jgi:hypothetical protein
MDDATMAPLSHHARARSRVLPLTVALLVGAAFGIGPTGAQAQSASCDEINKFLNQRKAIAAKLSSLGKKNIDATQACAGFTQLVSNGGGLIKWVEGNKDWCQIPDTFLESIKTDHGRSQSIRAKACGVAAKQAQMEKRARAAGAAGGGQSSGLLGGGGLEGERRLPQGAL